MATKAPALPKSPWFRKISSLLGIKKQKEVFQHQPHYNLQEIFQEINTKYFSTSLDLKVQWTGTGRTQARTMVRLGSYNLKTQKIKINRLLDSPNIPRYVLSYVVYHEMLHHLLPPLQSPGAKRKIHHPLFLQKEREFKEYEESQAFLKTFKKRLFFSKEFR